MNSIQQNQLEKLNQALIKLLNDDDETFTFVYPHIPKYPPFDFCSLSFEEHHNACYMLCMHGFTGEVYKAFEKVTPIN